MRDQSFDYVLRSLPPAVSDKLAMLPPELKARTQEIRLRVDKPVALFTGREHLFVDGSGRASSFPGEGALVVPAREMGECFKSICSYSIHTHYRDIINGFVTLKGGHRAGICGSCVYDGGQITGMRDISSINIRVARECKGAADYLVPLFEQCGGGLLLAGTPGSGKTTMLRDLARQLSSGKKGRFYKVAIVDERCEIAAVYAGVPQVDLGYTCDVLDGFPKESAITMAVRSLSPDVIICDELGDRAEMEAVRHSVNCGVRLVATVHAAGIRELLRRDPVRALLESGAFEKIIFLRNSGAPCEIQQITDVDELNLIAR